MLLTRPGVRRGTAGLALGCPPRVRGRGRSWRRIPPPPSSRAIALAEASLQKGEFPAAESHYREALFEGWLLIGTLERLDDRLPRGAGRATAQALRLRGRRPGAGCGPWRARTSRRARPRRPWRS